MNKRGLYVTKRSKASSKWYALFVNFKQLKCLKLYLELKQWNNWKRNSFNTKMSLIYVISFGTFVIGVSHMNTPEYSKIIPYMMTSVPWMALVEIWVAFVTGITYCVWPVEIMLYSNFSNDYHYVDMRNAYFSYHKTKALEMPLTLSPL